LYFQIILCTDIKNNFFKKILFLFIPNKIHFKKQLLLYSQTTLYVPVMLLIYEWVAAKLTMVASTFVPSVLSGERQETHQ
jgi:hypothetical protein